MRREEMLAKVEAAYGARRSGELEKLREFVAEDAVFSFAGEGSLLADMPGSGQITVHRAAKELYEAIELRELDQLAAVAEDNRVAILWRTKAAVRGGEEFETLMFDLWEFDGSEKICKGTQFIDTAKFVQAMRSLADTAS